MNKKIVLIVIMIMIIISILFYLSGSVIEASFEIHTWGKDTRTPLGAIWLLCELIALIAGIITHENQ